MAYRKSRSRTKGIAYDLYFGLLMVAGGAALVWYGLGGSV